VYVCMCICMFMYVCVSVYTYVYTCIYTRVWVYICTCVGAFCLFVLSNLSTICVCIRGVCLTSACVCRRGLAVGFSHSLRLLLAWEAMCWQGKR